MDDMSDIIRAKIIGTALSNVAERYGYGIVDKSTGEYIDRADLQPQLESEAQMHLRKAQEYASKAAEILRGI